MKKNLTFKDKNTNHMNNNIDHSHFSDANIMCGTDIFNGPNTESDMLQTTQHDDSIDGSAPTMHLCYQPPCPFAMRSLQALQEIGVTHAAKGQATPNMKHYLSNIFWST